MSDASSAQLTHETTDRYLPLTDGAIDSTNCSHPAPKSGSDQRSVIDALNVPVIRVNRAWQITFANPAAITFLQGEDGATQIVDADLRSCWPGEATDVIVDHFERTLHDPSKRTVEIDVVVRDQRFLARMQPIEAGVLILLLERPPDHDAAHFQSFLLEQAESAYLAWDLHGGIVLWNRGAEQLYGYRRAEAIGRVSHDLLQTVHPDGLNAMLEELRRDGVWQGELHHLRKDGGRVLIESRHQLIVEGDRSIVLESSREITDPRQLSDGERHARDAARDAEARYRGLFERSADAVLIIDETGRFLDANPATVDLLGYDLDELITLTLTEISVLTQRAVAGNEEGIFPLAWSGESWTREIDLRRKDGTVVPIEARATTISTPTGPAIMIAARDISDRRMFERMQQEFFASISHDLKNPLSALRGQVQLLQRRLRRKGVLEANDVEAGLETIENVGERMTGMIEELVDVAQLRGGNPLRLKPNLTDLVPIAARRVREHQQATTRHTVHLETAEPSLIGWWDESRLGRVIDNLLTNAIKYSLDGEIVVRLEREARDCGDWAIMTIVDSGLGIPAEDMPRIFERFRRGSNVLDRFAGTGLGLAGVRQIVLQHGGDVSITSTEGVGTTVTVALPMREPTDDTPDESP